jgi:hypothetical protein
MLIEMDTFANKLWAAACFFVLACGGSAFVSSGETGGAGGVGGSSGGAGGAAGVGGVSGGAGGIAGTAGSAGTTAGGAAGMSGSGGAAGISGAGGAGGSGAAGSGGAGTGGAGTGGTGGVGGTGGIGGTGGRGGGGTGGTGGAGGITVDAGTDWYACNGPAQCSLVSKSCCGPCEPTQLSQYVAVNDKYATAYKESLGCGNIACAPCMMPSDPTQINRPQLFAICQANRCTAVDVRLSAFSKCSADTDCKLRWGLACCEACSGTTGGLVAVSTVASELGSLVCSPYAGACLPCVPTYPANASAKCGGTAGTAGHCRVAYSSVSVDGG